MRGPPRGNLFPKEVKTHFFTFNFILQRTWSDWGFFQAVLRREREKEGVEDLQQEGVEDSQQEGAEVVVEPSRTIPIHARFRRQCTVSKVLKDFSTY